MALTGNTVQSTYLDLVQLEKSGAGLPSHAGKEAAVYDGSGAQICGRTAVRHWLDPHPDAAAFAETWEFSTTGDMTQGQLETAGWTFTGCTASVSSGLLTLVAGAENPIVKADLTVSLAGDFDFIFAPIPAPGYSSVSPSSVYTFGGGGVADTVSDVAHYSHGASVTGFVRTYTRKTGTWTSLSGTESYQTLQGSPALLRVSRVSGTVYINGGQAWTSQLYADDVSAYHGWGSATSQADSTTFNKLFLTAYAGGVTTGTAWSFAFLRRFQ